MDCSFNDGLEVFKLAATTTLVATWACDNSNSFDEVVNEELLEGEWWLGAAGMSLFSWSLSSSSIRMSIWSIAGDCEGVRSVCLYWRTKWACVSLESFSLASALQPIPASPNGEQCSPSRVGVGPVTVTAVVPLWFGAFGRRCLYQGEVYWLSNCGEWSFDLDASGTIAAANESELRTRHCIQESWGLLIEADGELESFVSMA